MSEKRKVIGILFIHSTSYIDGHHYIGLTKRYTFYMYNSYKLYKMKLKNFNINI